MPKSYGGNRNNDPSTGGGTRSSNSNGGRGPAGRGGGGGGFRSASPHMNNGMFKGSFEGPTTSLAVKYGKYRGIPSGFRSASPFMQGGVFRGNFEGPVNFRGAQRAGGIPGMSGVPSGYGGGVPPSPSMPVARPPAVRPTAVGPRPVSGLMGRPVFGPPAAPPVQLRRSMMPGLFGGRRGDSLTPFSGSVPSIGPFTGGLDLGGRAVQGPMGYSQERTGAYANSMYGNPQYGTPGFGGNLGNYAGAPSAGGFFSGGLGSRPSGYGGSWSGAFK